MRGHDIHMTYHQCLLDCSWFLIVTGQEPMRLYYDKTKNTAMQDVSYCTET